MLNMARMRREFCCSAGSFTLRGIVAKWILLPPWGSAQWVRDTKVDAEAIHQQNGLNPSVCVRKAAGAFVGQLGKLRPIVNGREAALAPDGGGSQPPRRLPACPTSRQRFHFYIVHPRAVVGRTGVGAPRAASALMPAPTAPPCGGVECGHTRLQ